MYFPTYTTLSTVYFGDFLQRLEVIAAIVFIISVFLKLSILLMAASRGAAKIFNFNEHRFLVTPIALLILNYAVFSFDSMLLFYEWAEKVTGYYSTFFEVVVPLVLLIIIEVKYKKMKKTLPAT